MLSSMQRTFGTSTQLMTEIIEFFFFLPTYANNHIEVATFLKI